MSVAVLCYAVVRHRVLGLDVKLRWGISKSTVAAVFIAVFFVASEGAQEFFGEQFDNSYIGIAAAGLLVVGIAPLQRMADRVAEKAVPVTSPSQAGPAEAPGRASATIDDFRIAYRAAARDGRVSLNEELALARLAVALGLDAEEVARARHDAEGDAGLEED